MTKWTSTRLNKELYNKITETIKEHPYWINELEFIRDAVREKLSRVQQENKPVEAQ